MLTQNSTQSYTNNMGHITHNEYNTKRVRLSLKQAEEAYEAVNFKIMKSLRGGMCLQNIGAPVPDYTESTNKTAI
jgi:hypothetical protein